MQGFTTNPTESAGKRPAGWRRDLALLALLLLLAGGVRAWVVWCTEVPARDSIGFIRYALLLEERGWGETLKHQHQHPGYPLSILAVSVPVRHLLGQDSDSMQLSAQLASALAGWLLVLPLFYLGKLVFDRTAGFWGALLFQCLPASGHVLSDAISDPLFLLFLGISLVLAVGALRRRSPWYFAAAGLACGLAYLTRPEGALILPAAGLTLLLGQCVPAWRQPWRRVLAGGTALGLAALVAGSPYFLTTGCFTNKPTVSVVTGARQASLGTIDEESEVDIPYEPPIGNIAQVRHWQTLPLSNRMRQAGWLLTSGFAQCYQYIGWLPLVVGLWWFGGHYRRSPAIWMVVMLFALDALVLWLLAVRAGYLSNRHVLVLVLCTTPQVMAVVRQAPYRLASWVGRFILHPLGLRPLGPTAAGWSVVLLLIWTGTGLARTLQPLHGNRAGHRAAGRWLAGHARPCDRIDDDHCWARFYANRMFAERGNPAGSDSPSDHYVVINRSNEKRPPSHALFVDEKDVRRRGGQVVYHWPETESVEQARVVVYRMPDPG